MESIFTVVYGIAHETWEIVAEASPWLLIGFVVAGFIKEMDLITRFKSSFSGKNLRSIITSTLIGIPLPLCSCSVIPLIHTMKVAGASRGATASFMTSTPQIGVDSYFLTQGLFGSTLAMLRVFFAFISAIIAGICIERTPEERTQEETLPDAEEKSSCCSTKKSCCEQDHSHSFDPSTHSEPLLKAALRFGFVELPKELANLLLLGFILSGIISFAMPDDFISSYLGNPYQQIFLATLFSVPIYVCATSSTPVAASLVLKGLSPSAALVFLLAGPATNIGTILIARKTLGTKGAIVYVLVIVVISLLAGISIEALNSMSNLIVLDEGAHIHEHSSLLHTLSGALILVLLCVPFVQNGLRKFRLKTQ